MAEGGGFWGGLMLAGRGQLPAAFSRHLARGGWLGLIISTARLAAEVRRAAYRRGMTCPSRCLHRMLAPLRQDPALHSSCA